MERNISTGDIESFQRRSIINNSTSLVRPNLTFWVYNRTFLEKETETETETENHDHERRTVLRK